MSYDWKRWLRISLGSLARKSGKVAAATIVAGGLSFVGSADALEVIENGSFELPSPTGWSGGFGTYSHATAVYYEGPAPAGSGEVYGWDPGIDGDQLAVQVLNLAAGISQIDAGTANYDFSGWLSSWTADTNYGTLELEWNDSTSGNGMVLGTPILFDGDDGLDANIVGSADVDGNPDSTIPWTQDNWTFYQSQGTIPVGTRSAIVRYQGIGNDAYADLVSLDLPFATTEPTLDLMIDRDLGTVTIENNTGIDQSIRGYSIFSIDGALMEANASFLADSDPDWVQLTAPGATSDLSEGHLTTYTFTAGDTIELGDAWLPYYLDETDVSFEYLDGNGQRVDGVTTFSGNNDQAFLFLDFDFDGDVDRDDWVSYASGLGTDLSDQSVAQAYFDGDLNGDLVNDHADFLIFKDGFDAANGAGAFNAMLVPEPSACFGFLVGLALVGFRLRRRG